MIEILKNKNATTRFQIMVEIAAAGPAISQKSIAGRLGVTPQAISEYIRQLIKDNLVTATGRSRYAVSPQGVNWMLAVLRDIHNYTAFVEKAVNNVTSCAAIAETDINQGQSVGIKMKNGLLFATAQLDTGARGIANATVKKGEDVDITHIEGLVELTKGTITILQVPTIQNGGSRRVNLKTLGNYATETSQIGAIGIEALISLQQLKIEPRYIYGVTEAAVEAAKCGLPFTVVCTADVAPELMIRLHQEDLNYNLVDLRLKPKSRK